MSSARTCTHSPIRYCTRTERLFVLMRYPYRTLVLPSLGGYAYYMPGARTVAHCRTPVRYGTGFVLYAYLLSWCGTRTVRLYCHVLGGYTYELSGCGTRTNLYVRYAYSSERWKLLKAYDRPGEFSAGFRAHGAHCCNSEPHIFCVSFASLKRQQRLVCVIVLRCRRLM